MRFRGYLKTDLAKLKWAGYNSLLDLIATLLMIHMKHCNNMRSYKTNRKLLYKCTNLDYVI